MEKRGWCKALCLLLVLLLAGCSGIEDNRMESAAQGRSGKEKAAKNGSAADSETQTAEAGEQLSQEEPEEGEREDSGTEVIYYRLEDTADAYPENRKEVAAELWRGVNGSFQPTAVSQAAEDIVPEGLIMLAEEALFIGDRSCLNDLGETLELTDRESVYETWFPDMYYFMEYVHHIYQYDIGDTQYLLLVIDSGGTARFQDIWCFSLNGDQTEFLCSMGSLDQDARVVSYEGQVYLVDGCYNYYSKYFDTIYLYPLTTEGIGEQGVRVSLKPREYYWTVGFQSESQALEQINGYVEEIGGELMAASPISDAIEVYTGCEEEVTDSVKLQQLPEGLCWYMVDADNDGRLEYLARRHWFPSNSTKLHLQKVEYRLEEIPRELLEKWEPAYPYDEYELIQQWYQEFDGEIYTFQLFLTEGYNYYLNAFLCRGEEVRWISSYYITPRCELQVQITGQDTTGLG